MAVWLGRAAVPRDRSALLGESLRPLQGHHKRRRDCDRTAPPCSQSSTESARAASQGSEGPSVGL